MYKTLIKKILVFGSFNAFFIAGFLYWPKVFISKFILKFHNFLQNVFKNEIFHIYNYVKLEYLGEDTWFLFIEAGEPVKYEPLC